MWRVCNLLNRQILQGDVLEQLDKLPNESIDCVITSPPYWGLRDYGEKGQWGLEDDFHEYLKKMQEMMRRIRNVLKKTGTVWINLGDSYHNATKDQSIQEKSRIGIPERFYIQCIDDNWIARNHIPWVKANSMPSSVKDRFTNKWESIFFFAKEKKYYFNLDAVREKTKSVTKPFNIRVRENITGHAQAKLGDLSWSASEKEKQEYNEKGERKWADVEGQSTQGIHRNRIEGKSDWPEWNNKQEKLDSTEAYKNFGARKRINEWRDKKQDSTLGPDGKPIPTYQGFNDRWKKDRKEHESQQYKEYPNRIKELRDQGADHEAGLGDGQTKNPGDVFNVNPRPFSEAHFAVFPPELPLKILKCACPPDGIVLDPFFGAGTVGVSAEMLGLRWVGIELKQEYIDIAKKRLAPYKNDTIQNFF